MLRIVEERPTVAGQTPPFPLRLGVMMSSLDGVDRFP